jgi:hypothetical protein
VDGVEAGSITDTGNLHPGGGYIGVQVYGTDPTSAINHFGGGTAVITPPANTVAPAVTGTVQVGQTLSCSTGTWTGSPTSYAYQWDISANGSTGWTNIGTTTNTYTPVTGDQNKYLRCTVTATNTDGSVGAVSNVVGPIAAATAPSTAFPQTVVLDNGQRVDENPISNGANWQQKLTPGDANGRLLTNRLVSALGTDWGSARWGTSFGPNCEVYGRLDPDGGYGWQYILFLRVVGGGTSGVTGYRIIFIKYDSVIVQRIDAGTPVDIATFTGVTYQGNALVGARMTGNRITVFVDGDEVGYVDDSTYSAAGQIGYEVYGTVYGFTSFGGGTYVGAPISPGKQQIIWITEHAPISLAITPPIPPPTVGVAGHINVLDHWGSASDQYVGNIANNTFYQNKIDRAIVYGGAPNAGWFTNSWYYADMAAIYDPLHPAHIGPPLTTRQISEILRDASNNLLWIPWGSSSGGHMPQYAADHGNADWRLDFRTQRIEPGINTGYIGTRLDDVNPGGVNTCNGTGTMVPAIDPRTPGVQMTTANWRRYIAEQIEEIRALYPAPHELLANIPWFSGNSGNFLGFNDPYIARIIQAADFMEFERGINDGGITGDNWTWSWQHMFMLVDYCHSVGTNIVWQTYATDHVSIEYQLAVYFLCSNGGDYTGGSMVSSNPATYWSAFDIELGSALSNRYVWNGLQRRDFQNGFVIACMPGGAPVTNLSLGGNFRDVDNNFVTTVTMGTSRGKVYRNS